MFFDKPKAKAPEWIKGTISVKVEDFLAFAEEHMNEKGYLNIDLKKSKEGKYYLALNEYKPKKVDFDNGMQPPTNF